MSVFDHAAPRANIRSIDRPTVGNVLKELAIGEVLQKIPVGQVATLRRGQLHAPTISPGSRRQLTLPASRGDCPAPTTAMSGCLSAQFLVPQACSKPMHRRTPTGKSALTNGPPAILLAAHCLVRRVPRESLPNRLR